MNKQRLHSPKLMSAQAQDVLEVFDSARRYSRALDTRARHEMKEGFLLFAGFSVVLLTCLFALLTLP